MLPYNTVFSPVERLWSTCSPAKALHAALNLVQLWAATRDGSLSVSTSPLPHVSPFSSLHHIEGLCNFRVNHLPRLNRK